MSTLVTIVHVICCLFLMLTVLLQSGKGGGMGAAFGGGNAATVFGGSGASTFLKKLTAGAATIFMLTSMTLAYIASSDAGDALEDFGSEQQALAKQKADAAKKALDDAAKLGSGSAGSGSMGSGVTGSGSGATPGSGSGATPGSADSGSAGSAGGSATTPESPSMSPIPGDPDVEAPITEPTTTTPAGTGSATKPADKPADKPTGSKPPGARIKPGVVPSRADFEPAGGAKKVKPGTETKPVTGTNLNAGSGSPQ